MSFSTPDLCDVHAHDLAVAEPLFNDYGHKKVFHGAVETVKCFEDNSLVRQAIERNGEGKVLVVDGGGSLRHSLFGDLLAAKAVENGWQGIVIYGCVRDVELLSQIDLGIKALAANPLKTERRGEGQTDVPVRFAGISFKPGYYLYADLNGVVVAEQELTF